MIPFEIEVFEVYNLSCKNGIQIQIQIELLSVSQYLQLRIRQLHIHNYQFEHKQVLSQIIEKAY